MSFSVTDPFPTTFNYSGKLDKILLREMGDGKSRKFYVSLHGDRVIKILKCRKSSLRNN